jgi:hypothetical protein
MREAVADLGAGLDRSGVVQLPGAYGLPKGAPRHELVGDVDVTRIAGKGVRTQTARVPRMRGGAPRAAFPSRAMILSDLEPGLLVANEQTTSEPPLPSGRNEAVATRTARRPSARAASDYGLTFCGRRVVPLGERPQYSLGGHPISDGTA